MPTMLSAVSRFPEFWANSLGARETPAPANVAFVTNCLRLIRMPIVQPAPAILVNSPPPEEFARKGFPPQEGMLVSQVPELSVGLRFPL